MTQLLPPALSKIQLSSPKKLLFPQAKLTKQKIAAYYQKISPYLLPYTKQRPTTLERYVHGIAEKGFYQKNTPDYYPSWIHTIPIRNADKTITRYILLDNQATLRYLSNQNCIGYHTFLSTTAQLHCPDKLVFDLDPIKGASFQAIARGAQLVREHLQAVGLSPFVMLTGKRGIHVVCPLVPQTTFDTCRYIARIVAQELCSSGPDTFSCHITKEKRTSPVYLDIMRNAFGQLSIAPYSIRPTAHASVATPLAWNELSRPGLSSDKYTVKTINKRLARIDDPWKDFEKQAIALSTIKKHMLFKTWEKAHQ